MRAGPLYQVSYNQNGIDRETPSYLRDVELPKIAGVHKRLKFQNNVQHQTIDSTSYLS